MADAMGIPLRSYQHFEAGGGRLNIGLVFAFAAATRSDPMAIVTGVLLDVPELAVLSADNKLVSALFMNLEAFHERVGDKMKTLRANTVEKALRQAFDEMGEEASQPELTSTWLAKHFEPPDTPDEDGSG